MSYVWLKTKALGSTLQKLLVLLILINSYIIKHNVLNFMSMQCQMRCEYCVGKV